MSLEIKLLGPPEIMRDGTPVQLRGPKTLALLAYLLAASTPCSRRQLVDLLYDDSADPRASLRWTLSHLRKGIGATYILSDRQTIQFDFDQPYMLDIEALAAGEAGVYRGEYLEGIYVRDAQRFMEWSLYERERWRSHYQSIITDRLEAAQETGAYEQVVALGQQLLALDNLREDWHRVVMAAFARQGQRDAALAQYELCRNVLADELEIEPEEATQTLYAAIEAGDLFETGDTDIVVVDPAPLPAFLEKGAEQLTSAPPVFVARQTELALLDKRLEKAIRGQGQVAFLAGEAGAGKSSLADAFARQAMNVHPELLVVWGRSNAYSGSGDAFLPFRTALAMLTGDVEQEWEAGQVTTEQARRLWSALPEAARALVEQAPDLINHLVTGRPLLRRCATAIRDSAGWLHELQTLAGRKAPGPGEREQSQFFEQAAAFLQALSQSQPLLIILDDLQWADTASLDLLFHLAREVDRSNIFFLGAYRPDEVALGRHSRITGQQEPHPLRKVLDELQRTFGEVVVNLDQVGAAQGATFVDALLDTEPNRLDERFRKAFLQRTDGHPLFAVELLRAMQDRGDLVRDEVGYWIARENLNWDALPARVEGVIAERINRLEAELRETLTVASVEGEDFTAQVVARVREVNERGLVRQLSRELDRRHRLVGERGPQQVGNRRLYRFQFRHALFQQHLYNQLGQIERELLHGEVGQVLETLYDGQKEVVATQLAWHFAEAGENKKAIRYLLLAGDIARNIYANAEAVRHYERAITLLKGENDYDHAARTMMKLGLTYHNSFAFRRARQVFSEGFQLWQRASQQLPQQDPPPAPHALRMVLMSPETLDPTFAFSVISAEVIGLLFSGLVRMTPDLDLVPDVAQSWEVTDGGKQYLFQLRGDVYWTDGTPVTAHDFEYAWKRLLNPATKSRVADALYSIKGAKQYREGKLTDPDHIGITAMDNNTLIVELERPTSYFPYLLNLVVARPLPKTAVELYGEDWTDVDKIVTNGPFQLSSWQEGKVMRLTKNPSYHSRFAGNVTRLEFSLVDGWSHRWSEQHRMYENDQLDIFRFRGGDPVTKNRVRQSHTGEYLQYPSLGLIFIMVNIGKPPFDNSRIRKALAMTVDKDGFAHSTVPERIVTPAHGGILPPGMPGHSPDISLPYDPEQALSLLAEAGYPGGRGLPPIKLMLMTSSGPAFLEPIIQGWQRHLGLEVQLEHTSWQTTLTEARKEGPHLISLAPSLLFPDPYPLLYDPDGEMWQHSHAAKLSLRTELASSQIERLKIFREIDRVLVQDAVAIPLRYFEVSLLVKPWIKQIRFAPTRILPEVQEVIIEPHSGPSHELLEASVRKDLARYIAEENLGSGGMGKVFLGRNTETDEQVAIKQVQKRVVERDPQALPRFQREGEALRRLNHPNIVTVLDITEEDGIHSIVMEYVPGGSLRELLDKDAPLPLERTLAIALELADALSRAHHLRILHRDIKPSNVLLAENGTPRLSDFGVARLEDQQSKLTQSGALLGTIDYMSPEACRGEPLDVRSDIWSFGVLLFEMLAGRTPFAGDRLTAILSSILDEQPAPDITEFRPDLPPALVTLLKEMLAKNKRERVAHMRQVAAQLEIIREGLEDS